MKAERDEIWGIDSLGLSLVRRAEVFHREQHVFVIS